MFACQQCKLNAVSIMCRSSFPYYCNFHFYLPAVWIYARKFLQSNSNPLDLEQSGILISIYYFAFWSSKEFFNNSSSRRRSIVLACDWDIIPIVWALYTFIMYGCKHTIIIHIRKTQWMSGHPHLVQMSTGWMTLLMYYIHYHYPPFHHL